jgi:hypothetical protein
MKGNFFLWDIKIAQFVRREFTVCGRGCSDWSATGFQSEIWSRFLKLSVGQTRR